MCWDLDYCDGIGMVRKAVSETINGESWISLHGSKCNPAVFVISASHSRPLLDVRRILNIEK